METVGRQRGHHGVLQVPLIADAGPIGGAVGRRAVLGGTSNIRDMSALLGLLEKLLFGLFPLVGLLLLLLALAELLGQVVALQQPDRVIALLLDIANADLFGLLHIASEAGAVGGQLGASGGISEEVVVGVALMEPGSVSFHPSACEGLFLEAAQLLLHDLLRDLLDDVLDAGLDGPDRIEGELVEETLLMLDGLHVLLNDGRIGSIDGPELARDGVPGDLLSPGGIELGGLPPGLLLGGLIGLPLGRLLLGPLLKLALVLEVDLAILRQLIPLLGLAVSLGQVLKGRVVVLKLARQVDAEGAELLPNPRGHLRWSGGLA